MGNNLEKANSSPTETFAYPGSIEATVNRAEGRVQLDIDPFQIPNALDVLGEDWVRKDEFHVTLVGSGQRIAEHLIGQDSSLSKRGSSRLAGTLLDETLKGRSFRVLPQNEIRVVQDGDRKTIVRMCHVEGMGEFFEAVSAKVGARIEPPPAHITLYTLQNRKAIGIYNKERLAKVTIPLPAEQIQLVRRAMGLDIITGKAYGWGKLARLLSQEPIKAAYKRTTGDFNLADLFSAFPVFAQILKERHREECYVQSRTILGEMVDAIQTSASKMPQELKGDFNAGSELSEKARKLREAITPKKAPLRKKITSMVQDILYSPPRIPDEIPDSQKLDLLSAEVLRQLETYDLIYDDVFELPEKVGRGRWEIKIPKETGTTIFEDITEILGDEAPAFAEGLATFLAKKTLKHLRRFTVIPVDILTEEALRQEADGSFPADFRQTEFFRRQSELENYRQKDLSSGVPFEKGTISFFTCFEGWPFYKLGTNQQEDIEIAEKLAEGMYDALTPGGGIVFFSWRVEGETGEDRELLMAVEKFWEYRGMKITKVVYSRSDLAAMMVEREEELLAHSPIFTEGADEFEVLVVEKLKT